MSWKLVVCCRGIAIGFFWNSEILLAIGAETRVDTHQHAKLGQNRPIGCVDIKIFSVFQEAGCRHLWLSNSENFIGWQCPEGPDASLYQISSKSVVPLRRYCDFANFQIWRPPPSWFFLKSSNFIGYCGREGPEHQHAKFRQNRSIGCEDIKIFQFLKMAAAILDFRNREFLFADGVCRAQTHHCTKFCQNRSFC